MLAPSKFAACGLLILVACVQDEGAVARFRVSGNEIGRGTLELNADDGTGCYEAYLPDIRAAHLMDRAAAGEPAVVLTFFEPPDPYDPEDPCVRGIETALTHDLIDQPGRYYVDLHPSETATPIELQIEPQEP